MAYLTNIDNRLFVTSAEGCSEDRAGDVSAFPWAFLAHVRHSRHAWSLHRPSAGRFAERAGLAVRPAFTERQKFGAAFWGRVQNRVGLPTSTGGPSRTTFDGDHSLTARATRLISSSVIVG